MTVIINHRSLYAVYDLCHQGDKGMSCAVYPKLHRFPPGKPVSASSFQFGHPSLALQLLRNTSNRL